MSWGDMRCSSAHSGRPALGAASPGAKLEAASAETDDTQSDFVDIDAHGFDPDDEDFQRISTVSAVERKRKKSRKQWVNLAHDGVR